MSQEVPLNRAQRRAAERDIKRQLSRGGIDLATLEAARKAVPHLFLAYLHPGLVHEMWMQSVLAFIARSPGKYAIRPAGVHSGPLLARARNLLVGAFLETDDEFMLWTDTDIVFTFEDVEALMAADAPIAGALYYTAATGTGDDPWSTALVEDEENEQYVPWKPPEPLPDEPLEPIEVACVGMGLTLVRREVIEALAPVKRLWPFAETNEERGFGEDLTFCLRAAERGFKTVMVPQARVGHIKEVVV